MGQSSLEKGVCVNFWLVCGEMHFWKRNEELMGEETSQNIVPALLLIVSMSIIIPSIWISIV